MSWSHMRDDVVHVVSTALYMIQVEEYCHTSNVFFDLVCISASSHLYFLFLASVKRWNALLKRELRK